MSAAVFRANYDDLAKVAASFDRQAEMTRQLVQTLQGRLETLQAGDWVGQGAQAFYAEMDSQVMPSLKRLSGALAQAAATTQQIRQTVQQAEADAAARLKGDQAGGGAQAIGESAGPANAALSGAGAAAFVAARPGPGRTRAPAGGAVKAKVDGGTGPHRTRPEDKFILDDLHDANPALADQVNKDPALKRALEQAAEAHWHVEKGAAGQTEVDYGERTLTIGPDTTAQTLTKDLNRIHDNPAILENSGLSPKAMEQIKKDPVLMAQVRLLERSEYEDWSIQAGKNPHMSQITWGKNNRNTIQLDPQNITGSLRGDIHTAFQGQQMDELKYDPKVTRSTYADLNTYLRLSNDSADVLNTYQAQQEATGKMPDTLPNGNRTANAAQYQQIVSDYWSGKMPYADANTKLSQLLQADAASNAPKYMTEYEKKWDALHQANP